MSTRFFWATVFGLAFSINASVARAANTQLVTEKNTDQTSASELTISKKPVQFFELIATGTDGNLRPLHEFKGQVVLVVNTASKCGHTPQYESLQKLHDTYKAQGFTVLGFPSNDFGGQEPGTDKEIQNFCKLNYGVNFPLFQKGPVKGEKKQPVFQFLTENESKEMQGEVKWNFEKFLVDRNGQLIARFPSAVKPDDPKIKEKLEAALKTPAPAAPSKKKSS